LVKLFGSRSRPKLKLYKLAPEDVLTTEESGKLLAPFIKPLPSFDDMVLGKKAAA
jgi:hypothetical protein